MMTMILWTILLPALAGLAILLMAKFPGVLRGSFILLAAAANLALAIKLFGNNITLVMPWAPFGMDFSLRLYHFQRFNFGWRRPFFVW